MSARTLLLRLILAFGFFLQLSTACLAQQNPDTANNADQGASNCPPLSAFPQLVMTTVQDCQKAISIEVSMPLKPDANGFAREKRVRGAYEYREYRLSQSNEDSAFENLVNLLPMAGFQVKYALKPTTITGRKENMWVLIRIAGASYNISLVRESEEELWTPVTSAEAISLEMGAHGYVDIYGIQFSREDQALQEKQSEILGEVLKYLKQNANLAVIIESHRASQNASPEQDMEVTRKRANAVVAWLVAHGISATRLQPKPSGRTRPLTENDTPIEILKNDRIVLARANK